MILALTTAPKVPEWPSYGNIRKVTQNLHFLKNSKGGTKGNFSKIAQKVALVLKGPKALWRKLNYTLIKMHLKCKDWRIFWPNSGPKSVRMGKLWQLSEGHPKQAFSGKVQRGDQGKFFKNRLKSSLRLRFSKFSLWRK